MLDEIIAARRRDLNVQKQRQPEERLRRRLGESPPPDFLQALQQDAVNIIAEVKFKSPSRGRFPNSLQLEECIERYQEGGAVAASILTEERFFDGSLEFLDRAAQVAPALPLLRKDFILDPYQVLEAAAHRASAYLLIVASLDQGELDRLIERGREFALAPLVEIHDFSDLDRAMESGADLIGVNNRNLKNFEVRLETSFALARRLEGESGLTLVAESGISEYSQIEELRDAGFQAFLIGTQLMEARDPLLELRHLRGLERS